VVIAFQKPTVVFGVAALGLIAGVTAMAASRHEIFYFDSEYQTIQIVEDEARDGRTERVLMISGGRASGVYKDTGETSFAYARAAFQTLRQSRADTLLVIGAAGFNLPRDASTLPYMKIIDAVDVDAAVKPISERYFLHQALPGMIRFFPLSARYAVRKFGEDRRHYGFTFLDAYFGQGIPEELVTLDFFEDVRRVSDRTVANLIADRELKSSFRTTSWRLSGRHSVQSGSSTSSRAIPTSPVSWLVAGRSKVRRNGMNQALLIVTTTIARRGNLSA
jgi:hypothetical protein